MNHCFAVVNNNVRMKLDKYSKSNLTAWFWNNEKCKQNVSKRNNALLEVFRREVSYM